MTSWNDLVLIEKYLTERMSPADRMAFETRLVTDPELRLNVDAQGKVYELLRIYNREKMGRRLDAIHARIFSDPAKRIFADSVRRIFE